MSLETALDLAAAKLNLPVSNPVAVHETLLEQIREWEQKSKVGPPAIRVMNSRALAEARPWLAGVELASEVFLLAQALAAPDADRLRLDLEAKKLKERLGALPPGDERVLLLMRWEIATTPLRPVRPGTTPPQMRSTPKQGVSTPPVSPPPPPPPLPAIPAPPTAPLPPTQPRIETKVTPPPPPAPPPQPDVDTGKTIRVMPTGSAGAIKDPSTRSFTGSTTIPVVPVRSISLRAVGPGLGGVRQILLLSGANQVIGRKPTKLGPDESPPDIPLPHTTTSFKQISRRHVLLSLLSGRITLRADEKATNGSRLGTQALTTTSPLPWDLAGEPELNLAEVLSIKIKHQASSSDFGPTLDPRWADESTRVQVKPGGTIRFTTNHSALADQRVAWVLSDCNLGRDPVCGITINAPSMEPCHLIIHHFRGAFWIEAAKDVKGVRQNGKDISNGAAIPLIVGQRMEFGGETWDVTSPDATVAKP